MQPSAIPPHWDWSRRAEPDELPEWMDEPCRFADLRTCLRDLGQVNRLTLGYRPTLKFLDGIAGRRKPIQPLRILDVGFGGGDALHRIALWAKSKHLTVELAGIDLNPNAARAAKEKYGNATIQWLSGDVFSYQGAPDVVISSLLTHHLTSATIVRFLQWMEHEATLGWFINDLERSARSASLFASLARIMRWHKFVRHDGPVSFARAFVRADWQRMLREGGLPSNDAEITPAFPSRLCVSRIK